MGLRASGLGLRDQDLRLRAEVSGIVPQGLGAPGIGPRA